MTNFKKITESPETLADMLYGSMSCLLCPVSKGCTEEHTVCRGRLLNWLKQEVGNGNQ